MQMQPAYALEALIEAWICWTDGSVVRWPALTLHAGARLADLWTNAVDHPAARCMVGRTHTTTRRPLASKRSPLLLLLPVCAAALTAETLPLVLPDPTDATVFPTGSTTPAVDTEGYLLGPGTPVKYMFPDPAPGARTTTKFWSVPNTQTAPGAPGTRLVAEWDTATITGRLRPLPLSGEGLHD